MRIGIDAREIENGVYTGIGRMLYNFLDYFSRQIQKDTCVLFARKPLPVHFSSDRIDEHVMEDITTLWWEQVQLPLAIRNEGVEVFYSPYYQVPLMAPCRKICTMLDLLPLKFAPYYDDLSLAQTFYYKNIVPRFIAASDRIVSCSSFSREEIMKCYDVRHRKIEVIPLSVSDAYVPGDGALDAGKIRKEYGIAGRYIIFVGTFEPHKNVETLLKAFGILAKDKEKLSLVLVGPKEGSYEAIENMAHGLGIDEKVVFTDKIVQAEKLRALYAGADVCVMPSFYEGFGLPALEAMACGTAVVASNAAAIADIVGDAALLVPPADAKIMADAVRRLLTDDALRASFLIKGRERAGHFREESVGRKFYDFLKTFS